MEVYLKMVESAPKEDLEGTSKDILIHNLNLCETIEKVRSSSRFS